MRRSSAIILTGLGLTLTGCANWAAPGSPRADQQRPVEDSDIVRVVCMYPPNMWRSFDAASDPNPEGFAFLLYLISAETGKAVAAQGTVHVDLYKLERAPTGETVRTLMRDWSVAVSELPQRKPSMLGTSYQPSLFWGDIDVLGDEVEIAVRYESPTGRIVQSQPIAKKVPPRKR